MPVDVTQPIRGAGPYGPGRGLAAPGPAHVPSPVPAPTPPADDHLLALRRLRRGRNVFALLITLCLSADLVSFAMVEWVRYFEPVRAVPAENLGDPAVWVETLSAVQAAARMIAVFAATGLLVSGLAFLLVALVGRSGGLRPSVAAFFAGVWVWVLLLPWDRSALDLHAPGYYSSSSVAAVYAFGRPVGESPDSVFESLQVYTPGSLMAARQEIYEIRRAAAAEETDVGRWYLREAGYFGRFVGFPAVVFLILVVGQLHARAAFREWLANRTAA